MMQSYASSLCFMIQAHGFSDAPLISPTQTSNTCGVLAFFWKNRQCKHIVGHKGERDCQGLCQICMVELFAIESYVQSLVRVKRLQVEVP
jgi:hypothetical protein